MSWRGQMSKPLLITFILLLLTSHIQAKEKYFFVSIEHLIDQKIGGIIIQKIYEKLNIDVDIAPKPAKRAEAYARSGKKDGEVMRIWTYGLDNKTNIRVPTSCYQIETMAFIKKDSNIKINTKADLKKYKLIKVRGVKHTENITSDLSNVLDVQNSEIMMKFLKAGRADVALTNTVDGLWTLKKLGYTNIVAIEKPLAVVDLFNYIHEKHEHLVPRVDKVIKKMKISGELQKVINYAEAKVLGE